MLQFCHSLSPTGVRCSRKGCFTNLMQFSHVSFEKTCTVLLQLCLDSVLLFSLSCKQQAIKCDSVTWSLTMTVATPARVYTSACCQHVLYMQYKSSLRLVMTSQLAAVLVDQQLGNQQFREHIAHVDTFLQISCSVRLCFDRLLMHGRLGI